MPNCSRLASIVEDLEGMLAGELSGLTDSDLLGDLAAVERIGWLVDAGRVRVAGEVGHRSRPELGDEGLSRSENFASPVGLVSVVAGVSRREARCRLVLGGRLRGRVGLGGVVGPSPFPQVSDALSLGALAVESAEVITRHCTALADRGLDAAEAEDVLVSQTLEQRLTPDQVSTAAVHLRELLDPDGAEPRDEVLQARRSLTFTQTADGMVRGRFALTPEQGGIWVGAIEALQSPRITAAGPRFVEAGEDEDAYAARVATADTRTQAQKNADTVTELIARAAGAPDMPRLNGATTTVNVHVALTDLEAGRGVGWIDGITAPVPVSTIEQLRCSSPVVTTVFGGRGEVLHHGKTQRLFTPAQNRALAARDGGCVWPDCDRPPSWCESHHVLEWNHPEHEPGRTDIDNGLLLCHFHHAHLHKSRWTLRVLGGVPHIVPPPEIDTEQTPIPTTRRRTTLAA